MKNKHEKNKRRCALAIVRTLNEMANKYGKITIERDFGYDWNLTIGVEGLSHVHLGKVSDDNDELEALYEMLAALDTVNTQLEKHAKPYGTEAARALYGKK